MSLTRSDVKKRSIPPMRKLFLTALTGLFCATTFAQTDSAAYYSDKGAQEWLKGRVLVAYKLFDSAYSYNKTDKKVVGDLAKALMALRRYPEARLRYLELEKLGDQSADTYNQLMTLSFNMRQFPEAVKYAQLLKGVDPSVKVAYYIGKAQYDDENYGEAIKYLNEAAKEDPSNAQVPYLVARAYADMNNNKLAIPYFIKALELEPKNTRWMYETALIYYAMNDDKNSLKYFELAIDNGIRQDNEFKENLAIAYLNNKQVDKGLAILEEMVQRRPADLTLLNMIAEANYDAKRYEAAIDYWDKMLELDKTNAPALYMIGMSYQKKGEKAKGQALCDKAIEMDPQLARNRQKMEMPGM
ncbi:tetratricopeptide repeat protein [Flaviaesturariibacter aridisoli]|uniref:Tetratricopeptide repeat protein n=2 Tax=Flaviaesturariibacter aridisoli TaxID=2545761 RepID=A0A4R4E4R1_9BACT|nr:tetratricopeptide repeat protein [Flaviaesturariibacter aridisoli]